MLKKDVLIGTSVRQHYFTFHSHFRVNFTNILFSRFASSVCSHGGGGGAQRHNDCDTLPNVTFPDSYLPIGLVTEGNKSHSPYFVEHCNVSILCMGKARASKWLKRKANRRKKGM